MGCGILKNAWRFHLPLVPTWKPLLKPLGRGEGSQMNVLYCQLEGYREALSLVSFRHHVFGNGDAATAYDNPVAQGDLPNVQRIIKKKGL